jgi:hypothetical protein
MFAMLQHRNPHRPGLGRQEGGLEAQEERDQRGQCGQHMGKTVRQAERIDFVAAEQDGVGQPCSP